MAEISREDVLEAVAQWFASRCEQKVASVGNYIEQREETERISGILRGLLERSEQSIYAKIIGKNGIDPYTTRLWLNDIFPDELKVFLKSYQPVFYLAALRGWFRDRFGERLQIEGDMAFAGLYLGLS